VIGPELRYVDTERKAYLPIGSDENPDGSWFQRISYGGFSVLTDLNMALRQLNPSQRSSMRRLSMAAIK
jgi:hypothetical protein